MCQIQLSGLTSYLLHTGKENISMEVIHCSNHQDTQTNLRCTRCEKPVCPQCMVHAPVGIRCVDCGQGTQLPVYNVPITLLSRAIATSIIIGVTGGFVYALILRQVPFGIMSMALLAGIGYLLAEAISLVSKKKRGRKLQYASIFGIIINIVTYTLLLGHIDMFDIAGSALATYIAFIRLK